MPHDPHSDIVPSPLSILLKSQIASPLPSTGTGERDDLCWNSCHTCTLYPRPCCMIPTDICFLCFPICSTTRRYANSNDICSGGTENYAFRVEPCIGWRSWVRIQAGRRAESRTSGLIQIQFWTQLSVWTCRSGRLHLVVEELDDLFSFVIQLHGHISFHCWRVFVNLDI